MSLLATVATKVGKVDLHFEDGAFTTRGVVRGIEVEVLCGRQNYVTTILITAERALEWHELAEREGHVYLPFPPLEAAENDSMDLQTECPRDAQTSGGVATT